jgi:MFS family permease
MALLEARAIRTVARRLVPFLGLCYFIAYLDRVNVSFAALTMNRDLGLSARAYGLGAGVFFLPYFLFEVPSNLLLARVGARRWIARIMLTWGLLSGAMAFVTGERSFLALRLALGAAEAGFFPGVIYYLTLWFPAAYRARIVGAFMAAIPLSTVIGAPVSGLLLGLDGVAGLRGWQWLFLVEALPAVLLAFVVLRALPDTPAEARWLPADERDWLEATLAEERRAAPAAHAPLRAVLLSPRVLGLAAVYFGVAAMIYGLGFFLPLIVQQLGLAPTRTVLVSALPYVAGFAGAVTWPRRSDRAGERRWHTAIPLAAGAGGLALGALLEGQAVPSLLAFCVAGWGIFAAPPVFWTLPTAALRGAAAAAGIATVNAIGNLAGFVGPSAMGALRETTGGYASGLLVLAAVAGSSAALVFLVAPHETGRSPAA